MKTRISYTNVTCDRCGKEEKLTNDLKMLGEEWTSIEIDGARYDLCPECKNALIRFIKHNE